MTSISNLGIVEVLGNVVEKVERNRKMEHDALVFDKNLMVKEMVAFVQKELENVKNVELIFSFAEKAIDF